MNNFRRTFSCTFLIAMLMVFTNAAASAPLRIIATIKPLHSLVAAVMMGVGEPELLIKGASSPHSFSLKPSDARNLSKADIVFWAGKEIELLLVRPLKTLAPSALIIDLSRSPGLELLAPRQGENWQAHGHNQDHEDPEHQQPENIDPHFWLNPDNAIKIVREIVRKLSTADSAHGDKYAANGEKLIADLNTLTKQLTATLEPVKTKPFIVFHDAFQYFEHRFNLNGIGAITLSPDRKPGVKRLIEIREKIVSAKAMCVFTEPQFNPAIARTVIQNTSAKISKLDPLGVEIQAGPTAYATLLNAIAEALASCLKTEQ